MRRLATFRMQMSKPAVPAALAALGLLAQLGAAAQLPQEGLDRSRNNYVLPEGSPTVPLGTLGRVTKRGSGPVPMILVPGHGFDGSAFDRFMADNADRYTMYAVTLPGFGGTPSPPLPPEDSSYMDRTWMAGAEQGIVELIGSERLDRPIVAGHFITGGQLALQMAVDHPDLVRGAVVLAGEARRQYQPQVTRREVVDEYLRKRWFKWVTEETWVKNNWPARYFATDPVRAASLQEQSNSSPLPIMIQYTCEFFASDLPAAYDRIGAPTLVLVPGFTPAFVADPENARALEYFQTSWESARNVKTISVRTIENAHIFLWEDQPEATAATIDAFVRRVNR